MDGQRAYLTAAWTAQAQSLRKGSRLKSFDHEWRKVTGPKVPASPEVAEQQRKDQERLTEAAGPRFRMPTMEDVERARRRNGD